MEPIANPLFVGSNPTSAFEESTAKQGVSSLPSEQSDNRKSPDEPPTQGVSSCGAVVVDGPHPAYGLAYKSLITPCHVWQRSFDKDGYGYFRREGRHVRAHIHYWEREHGPVPDGMELDHTCRNRACVNPDHLEPITHLENCRRGRLVTTGMTIEKAREVRQMRAAGMTHRAIGEKLGIGISLVAQIVTNRCWKDSEVAQ